MALITNGRGYATASAGGHVKPAWSTGFIEPITLAIVKGAPENERIATNALVNYYLGGEQQRKLSAATMYGSVRKESEEISGLGELEQEWLLSSDRVDQGFPIDYTYFADNAQEVGAAWADFISGL